MIREFCHYDRSLSAHCFIIELMPVVPKIVELAELTQQDINQWINNHGVSWLQRTDFDEFFDNKLDSIDNWIRVKYGTWGPEHITIPGNACGLDLDHDMFGSIFCETSAILYPHNVDSLAQKYLLTIIFTSIMEYIALSCSREDRERLLTTPGS